MMRETGKEFITSRTEIYLLEHGRMENRPEKVRLGTLTETCSGGSGRMGKGLENFILHFLMEKGLVPCSRTD